MGPPEAVEKNRSQARGGSSRRLSKSDVFSEQKKLGVSATLSLVGHGLAAALLLLAPTSHEIDLQRADEIAIEIEDAPPPPPPPALVVTEPNTPPVDRTVRPRPIAQDQPTGAIAEPSTAPELAPTTPLVALPSPMHPEVVPHDTVPLTRDQLHQLIDPTRVAAAEALYDDTGPSQPGPPATLNPESPDHGPTAEEAVAIQERELGAIAAAKTYITHRTFHLVPHTDGSYTWQGTGLAATIHSDGTVSFSDAPGVTMDWAHGSGGFDMTDAIMGAAGQDPHAAEREFFMEHAEETIARLEAAARQQTATHSLGGIRTRCRTIWGDASVPASMRRRQIFDVWDELADGEEGAPAREAVIAFIRREIPSSSPDSYTMIEVARMNASRQSSERFDPYP
jgi:hypothetical protein